MEITKKTNTAASYYSQFNDIGHFQRTSALSTHRHIEGFNSLVKYLVSLRRDATIDDEVFGELVKRAAASFVESEVTERIDSILDRKLPLDYILGILK